MEAMTIRFTEDGKAGFVYEDAERVMGEDVPILVAELGTFRTTRASHVEPTDDMRWTADMGPVGGPVLGPFTTRAEGLKAERAWLREQRGL